MEEKNFKMPPDEELGKNVMAMNAWRKIIERHGISDMNMFFANNQVVFYDRSGAISRKGFVELIGTCQRRHNWVWFWEWGFATLRDAMCPIAPNIPGLCDSSGELHGTVVETLIRKYADGVYDFVYCKLSDNIYTYYGISNLRKCDGDRSPRSPPGLSSPKTPKKTPSPSNAQLVERKTTSPSMPLLTPLWGAPLGQTEVSKSASIVSPRPIRPIKPMRTASRPEMRTSAKPTHTFYRDVKSQSPPSSRDPASTKNTPYSPEDLLASYVNYMWQVNGLISS